MPAVKLMYNGSPNEKINKDLTEGVEYIVKFKEECSLMNPILLLNDSSDDFGNYNYMYIPFFGRYYFIDNIKTVGNGLWEVTGHIDVLQTYKNAILENEAIIDGSENLKTNKYIYDSNVFITNCKHLTDIINFPSGLSDTGEFILITAGG